MPANRPKSPHGLTRWIWLAGLVLGITAGALAAFALAPTQDDAGIRAPYSASEG